MPFKPTDLLRGGGDQEQPTLGLASHLRLTLSAGRLAVASNILDRSGIRKLTSAMQYSGFSAGGKAGRRNRGGFKMGVVPPFW